MRCITNIQTGRWEVLAEWYGAERVVFTGDVFACCAYMATIRRAA